MADWVSSLLAGLGAGAESLGTSMSEREKRTAAAKQRAFELAMQQADKNAELGITDIAPRLPSDAALTKMSDTAKRIGGSGKPQSLDMLSEQLGLRPAVGGQVQKFTTPSPDFSIGGPTPDMSDAATNYEVSRTGASTFGSRPASPRFDNFTDQTVLPAATPASGGGASASIAKMLQPEMAPPVSKAAAPVSAAEQDLIDYGNQVRANPEARQTLASVMKGKTPEQQAVYMADKLTLGYLPAARQVEFDKLRAMGPQAYLNDVEIRMTPDMGPPSFLAGSDTPPAAPPSDPSAAPMAPAAGPRTVSALGAPTMSRLRLGSIPNVQSQLPAPSMSTGGVDEGESTVMQYDPLHPEAGLLRKRFNYQAGSDYAKKQAEENLPSNMLERQLKQGQIDDRRAQEQTRLGKMAINARTEKYLQSSDYFRDVQAVTNSGSPAALARITANTAGSDHAEGVDKVIQSALTKRNIDPNSPAGIAAQIAIAKGKSESGTKGADSEYSKMPADRVLRVVQGVHNMAAVHPEMEKFEQAAKTNPALFDGADQFLKEYNSEIRSGPVGFMHNLFKSQAIVTLNKKNPALAQYIRNGLRYAQGENEYQSRTSDFRTQMADMLATISSNMSPASIDAVTAGRKGDATAAVQMANQLRNVHKLPNDSAFGYFGVSNSQPTGGGSTKVLTPTEYKAARTHYSDAEIQAQGYTIPGKTP